MKTPKIGCVCLLFAVFAMNAVVAADDAGAITKTVWVDGKGQASMASDVNETHAKMNADGWRFADLEVYTEDGDMKGMFVTYVRAPVAGSAN